MIKLEGGEGYFSINGDSYPVGQYRIVYRGDNIGLEERGPHFIVHPSPFGEWVDSLDMAYPTRDALLTDLRDKIFTRL